jgi:hypothetical protein
MRRRNEDRNENAEEIESNHKKSKLKIEKVRPNSIRSFPVPLLPRTVAVGKQ